MSWLNTSRTGASRRTGLMSQDIGDSSWTLGHVEGRSHARSSSAGLTSAIAHTKPRSERVSCPGWDGALGGIRTLNPLIRRCLCGYPDLLRTVQTSGASVPAVRTSPADRKVVLFVAPSVAPERICTISLGSGLSCLAE